MSGRSVAGPLDSPPNRTSGYHCRGWSPVRNAWEPGSLSRTEARAGYPHASAGPLPRNCAALASTGSGVEVHRAFCATVRQQSRRRDFSTPQAGVATEEAALRTSAGSLPVWQHAASPDRKGLCRSSDGLREEVVQQKRQAFECRQEALWRLNAYVARASPESATIEGLGSRLGTESTKLKVLEARSCTESPTRSCRAGWKQTADEHKTTVHALVAAGHSLNQADGDARRRLEQAECELRAAQAQVWLAKEARLEEERNRQQDELELRRMASVKSVSRDQLSVDRAGQPGRQATPFAMLHEKVELGATQLAQAREEGQCSVKSGFTDMLQSTLIARSMSANDLFRQFARSGASTVTVDELFVAFTWLGLHVSKEEVGSFIRTIEGSSEVSLITFKKALLSSGCKRALFTGPLKGQAASEEDFLHGLLTQGFHDATVEDLLNAVQATRLLPGSEAETLVPSRVGQTGRDDVQESLGCERSDVKDACSRDTAHVLEPTSSARHDRPSSKQPRYEQVPNSSIRDDPHDPSEVTNNAGNGTLSRQLTASLERGRFEKLNDSAPHAHAALAERSCPDGHVCEINVVDSVYQQTTTRAVELDSTCQIVDAASHDTELGSRAELLVLGHAPISDDVGNKVRACLVHSIEEHGGGVEGFKALMRQFDDDGNASINQSEFMHLIRQDLQVDPSLLSDDDVGELVRALDDDGSGTLNANEIVDFIIQGSGTLYKDEQGKRLSQSSHVQTSQSPEALPVSGVSETSSPQGATGPDSREGSREGRSDWHGPSAKADASQARPNRSLVQPPSARAKADARSPSPKRSSSKIVSPKRGSVPPPSPKAKADSRTSSKQGLALPANVRAKAHVTSRKS